MQLDDLYQDVILDHYRRPRNAARLADMVDVRVHENPTCGDSLRLEVVVDAQGRIERIRHDSAGCAISVASTSLMTEALAGRTVAEAREITKAFLAVLRGETDGSILDAYGDLAALQGVSRFPVRVKCAALAWHALLESLPA